LEVRETLSLSPASNVIPRYLNVSDILKVVLLRKTDALGLLNLGPHLIIQDLLALKHMSNHLCRGTTQRNGRNAITRRRKTIHYYYYYYYYYYQCTDL